jgi:hypothetical protein
MEVLYCKYNRERLAKFQIGTIVFKHNDQLAVKKSALTGEAVDHIKNIYTNYELLKHNFKEIGIASAELTDNEVLFEYVEGESLEHRLLCAVTARDKDEIFRLLNTYNGILRDIGFKNYQNFKSCPEFEGIFGIDVELANTNCFDISNIDLSFENIIYTTKDEYKIIDYEWVFNFPIPVDYIIYRSVTLFFRNNAYLSNLITIEELWEYFGITNEQLQVFHELNLGISNYVYGSLKLQCLLSFYTKPTFSVNELVHENKAMRQVIVEREQQLTERDQQLAERNQQLAERDQQLAERDNQLAERGQQLADRNQQLADRNQQLAERNQQLDELNQQLVARDQAINSMYSSYSWKVTAPLRKIASVCSRNK